MRYRVDAWLLVEDGKTYGKSEALGDVVETERPLDKLFANKFTRLSDKAPAKSKKVQKAAKEEEEEAPAEGEFNPEGDASYDNAKTSGGVCDVASPLGENVTEDFPDAVEANLSVFNKGQLFFVADPEEPEVPLNEKELKKFNVKAFCRKWGGLGPETVGKKKPETGAAKAAKKSDSKASKSKSKAKKDEPEDDDEE